MRRVLATDLAIWPVAAGLPDVSDAMLHSAAQRAKIANYLLLYDELVIPTGNLQVLPVLRLTLGDAAVNTLLQQGVIRFLRYDEWLVYHGGGHGLSFMRVEHDPHAREMNMFLSYFQPLDVAIDTALQFTNPPTPVDQRPTWRNLLLDKVVAVRLPMVFGNANAVVQDDFANSQYLRGLFSPRNRNRIIRELKGVEADQVRHFSPHSPPPKLTDADHVLNVGFENMLLALASFSHSTDITGDEGTIDVAHAKGRKFGFSGSRERALDGILEISNVPNIGHAFAHGAISTNELLELRDGAAGVGFRKWLGRGAVAEEARDIVRRFVAELGKPTWLDSLPMRALRFLTVIGIEALYPPAALPAGVADAFLLDKLAPKPKQQVFVQKVKALLLPRTSMR